eukprot:13572768-Alexandrium_andersonii.AAC.1
MSPTCDCCPTCTLALACGDPPPPQPPAGARHPQVSPAISGRLRLLDRRRRGRQLRECLLRGGPILSLIHI